MDIYATEHNNSYVGNYIYHTFLFEFDFLKQNFSV